MTSFSENKISKQGLKRVVTVQYGSTGCQVFKLGIQNRKRFLPTERKLLNFENWINGKVSKSAKI
jgi:hypothetical protein